MTKSRIPTRHPPITERLADELRVAAHVAEASRRARSFDSRPQRIRLPEQPQSVCPRAGWKARHTGAEPPAANLFCAGAVSAALDAVARHDAGS